MFISVFDIFKIGIGPSSSHTVGPMVACGRFLADLEGNRSLADVASVTVTLHGSLAFTGKGHATDKAVILGLLGEAPDSVDPDGVTTMIEAVERNGELALGRGPVIPFEPGEHIVFDYGPPLAAHPNGMTVKAADANGEELLSETYYSIGGGFVATHTEIGRQPGLTDRDVPFPFDSAAEMLNMGAGSGLTIADMKRANEKSVLDGDVSLNDGLKRIWRAMNGCIDRGLEQEGTLPGGLDVKRRAKHIWADLSDAKGRNYIFQHAVMDYISVYALAVNEENAAGGRVVTSPTNGAAGVIPAVGRYYLDFCPDASEAKICDFLLTAAAIGGVIKTNASISGAEVGCQGEVGSASAMAAAGLCAVLGGTNMQIENAAEIALEHHLGMTCDPVGGLVQVPCIERNAMGAVKAVNAASLALHGDGAHFVPLDSAIETMRQTGVDMLSKYKETSEGGLAVNVTEC